MDGRRARIPMPNEPAWPPGGARAYRRRTAPQACVYIYTMSFPFQDTPVSSNKFINKHTKSWFRSFLSFFPFFFEERSGFFLKKRNRRGSGLLLRCLSLRCVCHTLLATKGPNTNDGSLRMHGLSVIKVLAQYRIDDRILGLPCLHLGLSLLGLPAQFSFRAHHTASSSSYPTHHP